MRRRRLAPDDSVTLSDEINIVNRDRMLRRRNPLSSIRRLINVGLLVLTFGFLFLSVTPVRDSSKRELQTFLLFPENDQRPISLPESLLINKGQPYFGDFEFRESVPREIQIDDYEISEQERSEYLDDIDFKMRGQHMFNPQDDLQTEKCRDNAHEYDFFPNCNEIHQIPFTTARFLGHGEFRQAWLLEGMVMKTYIAEADGSGVDPAGFRDVVRDANVMEKLTFSPRIVNMYGICGQTLLVEALEEITDKIVPIPKHRPSQRGKISKRKLGTLQKNGLHDFNNFTAMQKLNLAIHMAEGLAELHGYRGGIINHGDVWVDQWMMSKDGRVILCDFNVAFHTKWDGNDYCDFPTTTSGSYTAPEELNGGRTTEACDMFSFGLVLYSILTGLFAMYDAEDLEEEQKRFADGELPFIDERFRKRSWIEGELADAIEKCLAYEPDDRISIFELLQFLYNTRNNANA